MNASKKISRTIQIVAAISINGKIADSKDDFAGSIEDQQFLQRKIEESDVLVMGRKTFQKHVSKTKKPTIVFSRDIQRIQIANNVHYFNDSPEEFENLMNLLQHRVVCVLGGAEIYDWFIKHHLVTDVYLSVEPYIFAAGTNLLTGKILEKKMWKLISSKKLNDKGTVLLHYQP